MFQKFYLKNIHRLVLITLLAGSVLSACKKADEKPLVTGNVIVANEGAFGKDNASVVFFDPSLKIASGNVFGTSNAGVTLGGSLNSIYSSGGRAFLAVQTSSAANDKIEVADITTMKSIASVKGEGANKMIIPRNCVAVGNQLYVTNWGAYDASFNNPNSYILVVDLTTYNITAKISVPNGADALLYIGNELYVAQSQGTGISVINTASNTVSTTIAVPLGPKQMLLDKDGKIWVVCNGNFSAPAKKIVRINPVSKAIEQTLDMVANNQSLSGSIAMNPSKDKIYLRTSEAFPSKKSFMYTLDLASNVFSGVFIEKESIYSFGVDPLDGTIYLGIAPNFSNNGTVVRFKPDGTEQDNFTAGIAPRAFLFR